MYCSTCGCEVRRVGNQSMKGLRPKDPQLLAHQYRVADEYTCRTCQSLRYPGHAIRDVVIIWAILRCDPRICNTFLHVPDVVAAAEPTDFGIVLSVGPGGYDKRNRPVYTGSVKQGMVVCYDRTVPWYLDLRLKKQKRMGNRQQSIFCGRIVFCGVADVLCEVLNFNVPFLRTGMGPLNPA